MRAFLWLFVAACTWNICSSLRAQSTADSVYHLHGSVVNGVTGRPIGRALVISGDRRLATMTNAEGQFTLDVSVPAASAAQNVTHPTEIAVGEPGIGVSVISGGSGLVLLAQRPGYLPARQSATVTLDAASTTRNIALRLMPSASVRGQITAAGAESLQGLRVQLLRHAVQDGRLMWQMAGMRSVGADGSFGMTDLEPGEYTVATSEWSPRFLNVPSMPPVSEQYPPDFLGDTRTLDGATKLHIGYGQAAQANLHVRAMPYYSVTIPVQGLPPNAGANVRVTAGTGFQMYQLGWNNRDGAVEGALPDGDYTVTVSTLGAQSGSAQVPLHVAGAPLTHAPVGLSPMEEIPVHVRDERTQTRSGLVTYAGAPAQNQFGLFLAFRSENPQEGSTGFMRNTVNGPVLQNLLPGRYVLQNDGIGNGYLASMTCDGVNLLTEALVVNASGHTAPVEVTLRDDGGTITGTVDMGSSGLQGARVTILPTDGSGHVLNAYVSSSGRFQMGNVPPGSYRVFATPADESDTLPYRDAEAMRPLDSKGGAVTVMAGQTAQAQAELIETNGTTVRP